MEKLEELLPGIEEFLIALETEHLSSVLEKKRQILLERLEVYKLPPSLPPRPDGLPKLCNGVNNTSADTLQNDDFIAKLREASRQAELKHQPEVRHDVHACQEDEGDLYEGVEISNYPGSSIASEGNPEGETYETPLVEVDVCPPPPSVDEGHQSDIGSGSGSYESYDDDDALYENQKFDSPRDNIPLPSTEQFYDQSLDQEQIDQEFDESFDQDYDQDNLYEAVDEGVRTKVRKKRKSYEAPPELKNVTHKGELYQKGIFSPVKRYCVISDNKLLCFKSEKDSKPFINFPLLGYDVSYVEKEGKHDHVLKISHPSCEVVWFSADSWETAKAWIKHLNDAAYMTGSQEGVTRTPSNTSDQSSLAVPQLSGESSSVHGSSEGGSADGTVGSVAGRGSSPMPPASANGDTQGETEGAKKSSSLDKKKKQGGLFGNFFETFGKKKGDKVRKMLPSEDCDPPPVDPDAKIYGYLNVMSPLASNKKWNKRWCVIKKSLFYSYMDGKDSRFEFTLPLSGLSMQAAPETKRDLAIKLVQNNKDQLVLEPENSLEHGKWLNVLIKVTEGREEEEETEEEMYQNTLVVTNNNVDDDLIDELYDEVCTLHTDLKRGNASSTSSSFSSQGASTVSSSIPSSRDTSGDTEYPGPTETPPPLPKSHPPNNKLVSRPSLTKVSGSPKGGSPKSSGWEERGMELGEEYDDVVIQTDNSSTTDVVSVESVVDSVFRAAKSKFSEARPDAPDSGWRVARVTDSPLDSPKNKPRISPKGRLTQDTSRKKSERRSESKVTEEKPEVVKCHSGPTIAEDAELLKSTQNALLKDLKKEKGKREFTLQDRSKLDKQIDEKEKEYENQKRKRSEARSKVLASRGSRKAILEKELQKMEEECEATDKELTKLRLLAKEKDALTRKPSLERGKLQRSISNSSTSSSPAREIGSSQSSRIPSATNGGETKARSISPLSTASSNLNSTAKPWQGKGAPEKSSAKLSTRTPALSAALVASSSKASTRTVSATTKRAIARWNSEDADTSPSRSEHSSRSSASKLSASTKSGQQGSALPRTSRLGNTTTTKPAAHHSPTGLSQGPAETRLNNGPVANTAGDANANPTRRTRSRPVRTVQGQVKLWESLADGSNC